MVKLLKDIWRGDDPAPADRIVDVYIRRLCGKVEADPNDPRLLVIRRGDGYGFVWAAREWEDIVDIYKGNMVYDSERVKVMTRLIGGDAKQLMELGYAFLLSAAIGFERELRRKSAGLRTYTLVGTTAALFLLVSKYGFTDVLLEGRIVLDPSRVAAQIVTGIGFIGAGVIFVEGDRVKGLTTAATVWLVTGVGMACGAGLPILAVVVTIAYFCVAFISPLILSKLPGAPIPAEQSGSAEHD